MYQRYDLDIVLNGVETDPIIVKKIKKIKDRLTSTFTYVANMGTYKTQREETYLQQDLKIIVSGDSYIRVLSNREIDLDNLDDIRKILSGFECSKVCYNSLNEKYHVEMNFHSRNGIREEDGETSTKAKLK